jgi:hypothetical protein
VFLLEVHNGSAIIDTELVITQVFDDNAATLTVGTPTTNDLIMTEDDNNPKKLGNYGVHENYFFTGDDVINLYINPGASTQGEGYVLILTSRLLFNP